MIEGMTNDGWTSVIQIQAMPLKVGNVSLFSCFIVGRPFFLPFRFDRIFSTNPSPSPNTRCQDRKSYPLLSGADAKFAVRCVTGQDREHGARGSGYLISDVPL